MILFLNIFKCVEDANVYNRIFVANFDLDIQYLETSLRNLHGFKEDGDEANGNGGNVALESTFTELSNVLIC